MLTKNHKFYSTEELAEKNHYAERSLPRMGQTTVHMAPLILEIPLFSIARGTGDTVIDEKWERKGRGGVRYRGNALTQAHLTVLLTLLKERAGQPVSNIIQFFRHELLERMGWSDNSRNGQRLADIIEDLFDGRLDVWGRGETDKSALSVRFVAEKHTPMNRGEKWSVVLSETVLQLYRGHLSFLNIEKRKGLREGLATFMYGVICANSCAVPFSYADLHKACGSQAKRLAAFKESLGEALNALVAAGCIEGYKAGADSVRIH
jgi:hypothetical protein